MPARHNGPVSSNVRRRKMPLPPEHSFVNYYHQEQYLFEVVGPRFHKARVLSAFDFFCIVIWKANRVKSRIAKRLLKIQPKSIEDAVQELTSQIADASCAESRLAVLIEGWGFRIPMASAILTVLYPQEFTIYDVRVCDSLKDFTYLANTTEPSRRWAQYGAYCQAVDDAVKNQLSLRDKDRWLWGKSFFNQLQRDISSGFNIELQQNSDA